MTCSHEPPCPDFAAHRERQRADWKRAIAARNRALRNGRARRKPPGYQPGMNTRRTT